MVCAVEERTVVFSEASHHRWRAADGVALGEEQVDKSLPGANAGPGLLRQSAGIVINHIPIEGRCHQECGALIAIEGLTFAVACTIIGDGHHHLLLCSVGVVVGHEKQLVGQVVAHSGGAQLVGRVDHLACIFLGLAPLRLSGIHLGVEVKPRQEHPSGGSVGVAVASLAWLGQQRLDGQQLVHHKVEGLAARHLPGGGQRPRRGERNVAKGVEKAVVKPGTQPAHFGVVAGIVTDSAVQVGVARVDAGAQVIPQRGGEVIVVVPAIVVETRHSIITP